MLRTPSIICFAAAETGDLADPRGLGLPTGLVGQIFQVLISLLDPPHPFWFEWAFREGRWAWAFRA